MANVKDQKGSILIAIVIMMPFFILVAISYLQLAVTGYRIARKDQFHTHAQFAADAGIDASLETINQDNAWPGTSGEVTLAANNNNVCTTYQTTVSSPDADHKVIVATGRSYHPATTCSGEPDSSVTITVDLRPVRSGNFSIVTGVGGLYLSNSAKVLGGDVFVNGELVMTGSSQVGLSNSPVNLRVAHQNCPVPADATYPRVCNPGENGEPISISNPAWIYGKVYANNQIDGSRMSDGSDPGLKASSGVATQALPPHVRADQVAAVLGDPAHNLTGNAASCTSNGGSVTWPANTKITGNVDIDKDCTVTIEGDVWITGNFAMNHSKAKLKVAEGVTVRPNLMIDGPSTTFRNGSTIVGNSGNIGVQVITYHSSVACSVTTGCEVTGVDLYNSRDDATIILSQTSGGANSIFYAKWSKVLVENSGEIGALVGQTVEMQNSGTITFGTSVGTPTEYWVIDTYRRTF